MGTGTFDKLKDALDEEYKEFLDYRTTPDEFQIYRNTFFQKLYIFLMNGLKIIQINCNYQIIVKT